MALEASADLSIFPRPAPGNLHLVNWGSKECHYLTEHLNTQSWRCASREVIFWDGSFHRRNE